MAIEAHFHPYFGQVNQNMPPAFDPNSNNVYVTTKYNNNQPLTLPVVFRQQRDELNQFITSQNENLRILVQEQRRQQLGTLLKKVESDMFHILSQKDEQISQAAKRRMELEQFLTRLETENQSLRRAAHENEAMVLSLNNALEKIKERALAVEEDDVESCCDMKNHHHQQQEEENNNNNMMICKCCHSRESSFMFLPCRHLCSCKACEPSLQACPVCLMPKRSIIETLIF